LLLGLGRLLPEATHVLDKTLLEDDGLQVLQVPQCLLRLHLLQLGRQSLPGWPRGEVQLVRNLNDVQIREAAFQEQLVGILTQQSSPLHSDALVDLLDVLTRRRGREVLGLEDRPVDEFTPVLPHLLFINDAEELADELRVDSDHLKELEPQREYLG